MTTYSFIKGLLVTINSDAPACFGGYVNDNYQALEDSAGATRSQLVQLAKNSFTGSFLSDAKKAAYREEIDRYAARNQESGHDRAVGQC